MSNDLQHLLMASRTLSRPARNTTVVRRLWEGWKQLARAIGDFQARVILVVFYFLFFAPFALLARWKSDPLGIKPGSPKGWRRAQRAENWAARQF